MRITQLNIYPVKSLRGIALEQATLGPRGLAFDRHWMVIDDVGRFVTQRQLPRMAQVAVRLDADALVLEHPEVPPLRIALARDDQPRVTTHVWEDQCQGLDEGAEAADWLGRVLGDWKGSGLRLVRFAPDQQRRVDPRYQQGEQAHTAYADGFPFLVTAESSLAVLNEVLEAKGEGAVPMARFRPNIVVEGSTPFAEHGWDSLAGNGYRLGMRKPCQRCKIITLDQQTGEAPAPKEPLRTLASMSLATGAYFGHNATLLAGEDRTIRVGDTLDAETSAG
ncbi:MOSC N-terminal beta barrel domain-containing protein [Halomonas sp. M4R5S39]|uniref:MOSC domain-containing protein n=1 Tax=Halomonas kalidii TaxID=3043293 RepID=UPI0024A97B8B|nr:MOSC N-terminal beta barrel domain-containing protein [Halomonas kalidii]MDI5983618.1 MOSC N-terminal beta barrel domain-containing protein [Halomonas kalidii]